MKPHEKRVLLLIILLAVVLRFAGVNFSPPAMNWDEISHGYNAYSILKTGEDEWGQTFPAIFRAYGDYKLPVYIYITAISEFFFGLTPFAVRLPSILAGTATVAFTYLLTRTLFNKSAFVAAVAALLTAITPWSLFLSRAAFEANLAITFIVGGVYFFLAGLRKPAYLVPSTLFLGVSVWTYNSARVFVPLLILALILIFRNELRKVPRKTATFSLLVFTLFFVPMFWQLANPVGQARYSEVAIINQGAVNRIIERRSAANLPEALERALYNRPVYFVSEVVKNYFKHFSPAFLFFEGGTQYQFSVPGKGLLYLLDFVFLPVGLTILIFGKLNISRNSRRLLIVWLILSPLASSLTREAPHVLRTSVIIPLPMILSGLGLTTVAEKLRANKLQIPFLIVYVILLFFCVESYLIEYFSNYRKSYSWSWQYGYKEVVEYARGHYNDYDKIVMTKKYGEPHEFVLFYNEWDPESYRSDPNLVRFNQSNWYWVDAFDKYFFVNDWQIAEERDSPQVFRLESGGEVDCRDIRCLLITSPDNRPADWRQLEAINFLDGQPAFEIYEN